MVTSIQTVASPAFQPKVADVGPPQSKVSAPNIGGGSTDKVTISPAVGIQLGQDQSIAAGKLIKQTDQVLASQQEKLGKMNEHLQGVLKQFPPYGVEDPQRVAYLKSFSGLRQEIESLQFPRDTHAESGLPSGTAMPSTNAVTNLPQLDNTKVSDKQVADAAQHVQNAMTQVAGQRSELTQSVQAALGGGSYSNLVRQLS